MKRLAYLAAVLAAGAVSLPMAPPPASAEPTYEQGLTSPAVREIQQRLRALRYYAGPLDGVWGRGTEAAVQRFQANNRLQVTGQMDPGTATAMGISPHDLLARGSGSAPRVAAEEEGPSRIAGQPLSPEVVRTIQSRLKRQGFYPGHADGVWGPGTQAAVERFQHNRGLQVTGQLTPTTIQELGLDPNNLMAQSLAPLPPLSGSSNRR